MSKDEAIKQLQGMVVGAEWLSDSMVQALSVAIEALSADVVEVRHGYWDNDMECSICGCLAPVSHVTGEEYAYEYCPNCGARMDEEERKPFMINKECYLEPTVDKNGIPCMAIRKVKEQEHE